MFFLDRLFCFFCVYGVRGGKDSGKWTRLGLGLCGVILSFLDFLLERMGEKRVVRMRLWERGGFLGYMVGVK